MPGGLLYSDGDGVTLTWNPVDVLPTEIADPNSYDVTVEVHMYTTETSGWGLFQELHTGPNSGTAVVHLQPGPTGFDQVVPITFRITPADSMALEEYIRPIVRAGVIGIWSPVAYKIASQTYSASQSCMQFVQSQFGTALRLKHFAIPCPCQASQARIGNSMFVEQRSATAVQMRRFFTPKAATCFVSTTVG